MPVIGRRDDHRVDVLVVEQLSHVGVGPDARVVLAELVDLGHEVGGVTVAQGGEADAGDLEEGPDLVFAHTADFDVRADADDAQTDVVVGPEDPRHWHGHRHARCQRATDELSAIQVVHISSPMPGSQRPHTDLHGPIWMSVAVCACPCSSVSKGVPTQIAFCRARNVAR
jgi:hypothetical protein